MAREHDDNSSHNKFTTNRLEAFSDGVMAIIITITVLELKIPSGHDLSALKPLIPLFITYAIRASKPWGLTGITIITFSTPSGMSARALCGRT
jgi:hypothetical protein